MKKITTGLFIGTLIMIAGFASTALANHAWGTYHWARTTSSFVLRIGDNVDNTWQSYLDTVSSQWSLSDVLDTDIVDGGTNNTKGHKTPKNCVPTDGRVEVCNESYGNTGWLGVAQIWVSGDHIAQGMVKLNDSYFSSGIYNTPAWRQMVMCQEVGHTFGLDHQDEGLDNANLGTCMDYTDDPLRDDGVGGNLTPNAHDYDELSLVYARLDSFDSYDSSTGSGDTGSGPGKGHGKGRPLETGAEIDLTNPSNWGTAIRNDAKGRPDVYMRSLGGDKKVFTFVTWTQ